MLTDVSQKYSESDTTVVSVPATYLLQSHKDTRFTHPLFLSHSPQERQVRTRVDDADDFPAKASAL